jgi:hypothetical protein
MSAINESFLIAFKGLEAELKYDNKTVLDYENNLTGTEQEQLKVCRIMRNYMAHNDTDFISASKEQIKFLDTQVANIRKSAKLVKDIMKKIKPIKVTSTMKDIIAAIDKYGIIPVTNGKDLYLVDKDILVHQLAAGNKKIVIPTRIPKYKYMDKMERVENIVPNTYIVTSDGTANGEVLGILSLKTIFY